MAALQPEIPVIGPRRSLEARWILPGTPLWSMTLNTVKPRSAIRRLSPSMVCATDLPPGLVMTPSEDCVLASGFLSE
jgi:hypothetical protein